MCVDKIPSCEHDIKTTDFVNQTKPVFVCYLTEKICVIFFKNVAPDETVVAELFIIIKNSANTLMESDRHTTAKCVFFLVFAACRYQTIFFEEQQPESFQKKLTQNFLS